MSVQQRIDNTIGVSDKMNNHTSQFTEVFVSIFNEVDDEPVNLMRWHAYDKK